MRTLVNEAAPEDLTNRWSQPLAEKKITKVKLESRKQKTENKARRPSGGSALSR